MVSKAQLKAMMQAGTQQHQAGRLREAEAIYRQVLAADPRCAEALYLLGVAANQTGQTADAVPLLERAIALEPRKAEYHNSLGNALSRTGRADEAIAAYHKALSLRATFAEAWCGLGNALQLAGRATESADACRKALNLRPDLAEAQANLGHALVALGKLEEAVAAYQQAVRLKPGLGRTYNDLATTLDRLGRPDEAMRWLGQAVRQRVASSETYWRWAQLLRRQGKPAEAQQACAQALQMAHDDADAHYEVGNVLRDLGKAEQAIKCYRRAVEINPQHADSLNHLALLLGERHEHEEAVACLRQAIAVRPDFYEALNNLGNYLSQQGCVEEASEAWRRAMELRPDALSVEYNQLLTINYLPEYTPQTRFAAHRQWAQRVADGLSTGAPTHGNDRNPERPLRVGYVSTDLKHHVVASFLEPLLASHDHSKLAVVCYADVARTDDVTKRLQGYADEWHDVLGDTDEQLAARVRADAIDVLVDLNGHTGKNRLLVFARKPAPVQVSYLGYCNTTGLAAMDYRITDPVADPPGPGDELYTERLLRLPGGFSCYRPPDEAPEIGDVPALRNGYITFGSLHNLVKLNAVVIETWARLLHEAPTARLLILRTTLTEVARERLLRLFAEHGIGPERLDLQSKLPPGGHLPAYNGFDISLDVFPWSGHTTACESLWMGVPVVTLRGASHAGRMVSSVLTQLGLTEWIAETPEQYVALAKRMAEDLAVLATLRRTLRERMVASLLCDGPRLAREVEAAYRDAWRQWCAGGADTVALREGREGTS